MSDPIAHHLFVRHEDGWTYLHASAISKAQMMDSLERNTRAYLNWKFAYIHEPKGFHAAHARVRRINLKNKGAERHPDLQAELDKKKEASKVN